MKLVVPSLEFESSFANFYYDFAQNDVENSEYYLEGKSSFPKYVQRLTDEGKGINLPEGSVPCSHFWLVNADKIILGAIRVRHNIGNDFLALEAGHIGYDISPSYRGKGFGKAMFKLVLPKANALGIVKALVIADEDNIASRTVIESNGSIFEKNVTGKVFTSLLSRYWVSCE